MIRGQRKFALGPPIAHARHPNGDALIREKYGAILLSPAHHVGSAIASRIARSGQLRHFFLQRVIYRPQA